MTVELPKDAEGREIPLDVDALYDKNGERLTIYAWEYIPKLKHSKWRVRFLFDESGVKYYPDDYYLTTPDSWEKLEEDLSEISKGSVCHYFHKGGSNTCEGCPAAGTGSCWTTMARDIKSRIRKLRGED